MGEGREQVTIRVARTTVADGDTSKVTSLLKDLLAGDPEGSRNRVRFEVSGYGEDRRELWEIAEVRSFFRNLAGENEGLFFFVDLESDMLLFLGLMLHEPLREKEGVRLVHADLEDFLREGLEGLGRFCEARGLSPEKTERGIAGYVKRKVGN